MLAYLGKADNLLKRLKGLTNTIKLKSYSHGSVAALLKIAYELDVCTIINKHIKSSVRHESACSLIAESAVEKVQTKHISYRALSTIR